MMFKGKTCGWVLIGSVLVLGAVGIMGWRSLESSVPEPNQATPEQTVEYLTSPSFQKMETRQQHEYLEQVRQAHPETSTPLASMLSQYGDEEQQKKLFKRMLPVIGKAIDQRVQQYETLPPAERVAVLDDMIDRMVMGRGKGSGENSLLFGDQERFNMVLQYIDPYTRAKLRKHLPDLEARMKQRGLSLPWKPFASMP